MLYCSADIATHWFIVKADRRAVYGCKNNRPFIPGDSMAGPIDEYLYRSNTARKMG